LEWGRRKLKREVIEEEGGGGGVDERRLETKGLSVVNELVVV